MGWDRAPLAAAVDYLVPRYTSGKELDLSRVIVTLPGSRAGRRLLELLVQRAEELRLVLVPPQVVTEGQLPERLYHPQRPFAPTLVQQLTWLKALRQMPPAVLRPLVPHPPAADDSLRWLELAEMFRRQHTEFAADVLDFSAVLKRSAAWEGFNETERWETLCKLQRAYLDELDRLHLWDAQTARIVAIQKKEPQTDCDIILLGMVDMNKALRQMLDLVAPRVTALVIAPPELADRFDDHGCLIPEAWQQVPLPLAEEQMLRVDGPAEQAEAVVDWFRGLNGKYAVDEIVVGVADEALVPQLQREIAQQGLRARWVEGKKIAESAPYRLLEVAARYAERRRFADLAALVRHPDVYDWLSKRLRSNKTAPKDLLTTLDVHYETHLSAWIDGADLEAAQETDENARHLHLLVSHLEALFAGWPRTPQPVGVWMEHALAMLKTVYGDTFVDKSEPSQRYLLKCLSEVRDALFALQTLPENLQPELSLVDAVNLALQPLSQTAVAPPVDFSAIEILGWLELPLDDAPALIVTTVNEGFIPKSQRSDAFLPDALRRDLGLLHDDRRTARDAYALQVLAHSREELRLISARRDTNKDPLAPSRLLFAGEPEVVAQRALRWFSPPPPAPPRPLLLAPRGELPIRSKLYVPRPLAADWEERVQELLAKITVTQFKAYLACPYRFYLAHVLRLRAHSDEAAELDALAFGNLIHDVLQDFGREENLKHSTDAAKLRHYFDDRLDAVAAARCRPRHARAAVRVQIEQARQRLRAFAEWQAERSKAGWRIVYSEDFDQQLKVDWDVDDTPIGLHGRIDRIDYHPGERALAILDYKTGDAPKPPDKVHRHQGRWIDLQLPLYRHLYQCLELPIGDVREGGLQLGYITLPKDTSEVNVRIAEWLPQELKEADDLARDVVRQLRAGKFWPPSPEAPDFDDEFSAICQDGVLDRRLEGEEVQ